MTTIKDVARAAGVSVATVSRVYNGSRLVREGTSTRVREVGARLGYTPHSAARSLITRRTGTIGVLLPDLYGEFYSEVMRGIDQTAYAHGYHVLVSSSHSARPAIEAALRSMRGRVDGLIIMSPELDNQAAVANLPAGFPVVLLCCVVAGDPFDAITIANFEGAAAMVRHLLQLGHQRIAIIKGSERNYDAAERLRGYRAAMAEAGVAVAEGWEVAGNFTEESGFRAATALLERDPRPTAIFAANDAMAIGALGALRDAGVAVPDAVAVAGFDDIPMARYIDPPLASVRVEIGTLGERATTRLFDAIQQKAPRQPRSETLPTSLVLRRSCGIGRTMSP
jgi:LacI family transcriptional regulator